jgi:hypothetical protein
MGGILPAMEGTQYGHHPSCACAAQPRGPSVVWSFVTLFVCSTRKFDMAGAWGAVLQRHVVLYSAVQLSLVCAMYTSRQGSHVPLCGDVWDWPCPVLAGADQLMSAVVLVYLYPRGRVNT